MNAFKRTSTAGAQRPVIPADTDATFEILRARRRPLSRAALQARAGEAVTDLVWATCRWGHNWALGEYRFIVFTTDPSEDVQLYVQFWSEPQAPVCWEVCSGRWNRPADTVMAGPPTQYPERLGFAIGGKAENFQRHLSVQRRRDVTPVGRMVLDIFYDAFGYRGLTSIDGHLVSSTHADMAPVHGSFTPEDLCKTARRLGWTPRLQAVGEDGAEETAVIDLLRGRRAGAAVLTARVPDTRFYQSAFLDLGDPLPPEEARLRASLQGTSAFLEHATMRVGRTLHFAGGVTADWLLTQLGLALTMAQGVAGLTTQQVH